MDRTVARVGEARPVSLVIFGTLTAFAALSGVYFEPGQWYQGLIKPGWTPADWLFPLLWSALYLAIAVAGWRVWRRTGPVSLSLVLWFAQLALNVAWSWLFFGLHLPLLAFVDIVLLLLFIVLFCVSAFSFDRVAALLLLPYGFWIAFVAALNFSVWKLNFGLI